VVHIVERRLRRGDRLAWQENAWHLFDQSGEGLAFGATLVDLFVDIYDKFSESDVARGREYQFDKLRPVLAGISDGKSLSQIAKETYLSRKAVISRTHFCHLKNWVRPQFKYGRVSYYEITDMGRSALANEFESLPEKMGKAAGASISREFKKSSIQ